MLALIAFKVKLFQSASTIQIKYTANSLAMALSCFNIKTFLCVVQKLQCYPIHLCLLPSQFSKLSDCLVPEECALTTMTNGFDSLQGQNLPLCITEIDFCILFIGCLHHGIQAKNSTTRLYVSYVGSSWSLPCSFRSPSPNNSPVHSFLLFLHQCQKHVQSFTFRHYEL